MSAVVAVLLQLSSVAYAVPTICYNQATGGLWLSNDAGSPLKAIAVVSAMANFKPDFNLYAQPPGAVFDSGDIPVAIAYLNFPTTGYSGIFIGNVLNPGTPASDLSGFYYPDSLVQPPLPLGICFPEPSSCVMAAMSALAFAGTARRARRRCAASSDRLSS
ncbi:MAG: hypothetical protein C0485_11435 [Pirellula sp.]|nr:hypothetical protein [Pirellula sp.]